MHVQAQALKPISSVPLNADETAILKWIRSAKWEATQGTGDTTIYRAKLPEFFGGVRLYKVQSSGPSAAGAMGAVDVFIKKIEFHGVISKQELYPVITDGGARYLTLKKMDMDNLDIGSHHDDDDDYEDD